MSKISVHNLCQKVVYLWRIAGLHFAYSYYIILLVCKKKNGLEWAIL